MPPSATAVSEVSPALLAWYDRHARTLPWRARAGDKPDPYRVWLSEIMLQQTTVAAVVPYFNAFLARWPRVEDLAAAPLEAVLAAWAGLGYYARARNLHACARTVRDVHGGRFPDSEAELLRLPGIGAYTAAAVAAIAFDRHACVVDGNVERVVARLFAVERPLPEVKPELKARAASLLPPPGVPFRPGDFAQAMMDLGATVCLPRRPRCMLCPLNGICAGYKAGVAEALPCRVAKPQKPSRRGTAFWVVGADGAVLLRRRPPRGLLGGMMEVPTTAWGASAGSAEEIAAQAPLEARWRALPGRVRHTFTHFHLELEIWAAVTDSPAEADSGARWIALDDLAAVGLPSLMQKVVRHALAHG